ncbi:MAG: hypothetical protein SO135_02590 [Sphaerochaetaceae bacterium]|jgi:hypothetical protein|nr:hypothetical protein [Sphaerochaetaceae bacterium]NLY07094.1 hypothetical protein [Spirochaetales bacterium]
MSKGKGFFKGLLAAIIICALSFAVIYFFVPGMSEKYFGMSFKNGDVSEKMAQSKADLEKLTAEIRVSLKNSGATDEQISTILVSLRDSEVWNTIKEGSADAAREVSSFVNKAAKELKIDVSLDSLSKAISNIDFAQLGKNISSFASDLYDSIIDKLN